MKISTMSFLINWSTSELNTQVNPTTCLGDTGCWIQQVTAPTLVVTCWIHQCASISPSTCTFAPPFQLECEMHTDCWIQQVTTRVGAVTCWIQQSVSPKQVVGFTCVFNSENDQLVRKFIVWELGALTHLQAWEEVQHQLEVKSPLTASHRTHHAREKS